MVGLDRSAVSRVELGERSLTVPELARFARVYRGDPARLGGLSP